MKNRLSPYNMSLMSLDSLTPPIIFNAEDILDGCVQAECRRTDGWVGGAGT